MALRVVFLGSPAFAVPSLTSLTQHNNVEVALVVTQPDRPAGRGRRLTEPPVKQAARNLGLPIIQPETLRNADSVQVIADARPAMLVVVAYGELLRRAVLELAPLGCINVHPSLLPKYRGASPIPAAILNGDTTTGVTIMKLVRKLDAGPILRQMQVDISPEDTAGTLGNRLAQVAAEMLPATCLAFAAGEIDPRPQDDEAATYTREWTAEDARIDWTAAASHIERLVRAANPWPVAWTQRDGDRLRVLSAAIDSATGTQPASDVPGTVMIDDRRVIAVCGAGRLELREVQPAGKRPMAAADWFRGLRADQVQLDS